MVLYPIKSQVFEGTPEMRVFRVEVVGSYTDHREYTLCLWKGLSLAQTINGGGVPVVRSASLVWLVYTNFNTSLRNIMVISCNVRKMIDTKLLSNWFMWFYVEFIEHLSRNIAGMSSASAQAKKMQATYNWHMEATEMGKIIMCWF